MYKKVERKMETVEVNKGGETETQTTFKFTSNSNKRLDFDLNTAFGFIYSLFIYLFCPIKFMSTIYVFLQYHIFEVRRNIFIP